MNFIFIIDTSFSMLQYFDRNYTYIDCVKNVVEFFIKKREMIRQKNRNDKYLLITTSDPPEIISDWTHNLDHLFYQLKFFLCEGYAGGYFTNLDNAILKAFQHISVFKSIGEDKHIYGKLFSRISNSVVILFTDGGKISNTYTVKNSDKIINLSAPSDDLYSHFYRWDYSFYSFVLAGPMNKNLIRKAKNSENSSMEKNIFSNTINILKKYSAIIGGECILIESFDDMYMKCDEFLVKKCYFNYANMRFEINPNLINKIIMQQNSVEIINKNNPIPINSFFSTTKSIDIDNSIQINKNENEKLKINVKNLGTIFPNGDIIKKIMTKVNVDFKNMKQSGMNNPEEFLIDRNDQAIFKEKWPLPDDFIVNKKTKNLPKKNSNLSYLISNQLSLEIPCKIQDIDEYEIFDLDLFIKIIEYFPNLTIEDLLKQIQIQELNREINQKNDIISMNSDKNKANIGNLSHSKQTKSSNFLKLYLDLYINNIENLNNFSNISNKPFAALKFVLPIRLLKEGLIKESDTSEKFSDFLKRILNFENTNPTSKKITLINPNNSQQKENSEDVNEKEKEEDSIIDSIMNSKIKMNSEGNLEDGKKSELNSADLGLLNINNSLRNEEKKNLMNDLIPNKIPNNNNNLQNNFLNLNGIKFKLCVMPYNFHEFFNTVNSFEKKQLREHEFKLQIEKYLSKIPFFYIPYVHWFLEKKFGFIYDEKILKVIEDENLSETIITQIRDTFLKDREKLREANKYFNSNKITHLNKNSICCHNKNTKLLDNNSNCKSKAENLTRINEVDIIEDFEEQKEILDEEKLKSKKFLFNACDIQNNKSIGNNIIKYYTIERNYNPNLKINHVKFDQKPIDIDYNSSTEMVVINRERLSKLRNPHYFDEELKEKEFKGDPFGNPFKRCKKDFESFNMNNYEFLDYDLKINPNNINAQITEGEKNALLFDITSSAVERNPDDDLSIFPQKINKKRSRSALVGNSTSIAIPESNIGVKSKLDLSFFTKNSNSEKNKNKDENDDVSLNPNARINLIPINKTFKEDDSNFEDNINKGIKLSEDQNEKEIKNDLLSVSSEQSVKTKANTINEIFSLDNKTRSNFQTNYYSDFDVKLCLKEFTEHNPFNQLRNYSIDEKTKEKIFNVKTGTKIKSKIYVDIESLKKWKFEQKLKEIGIEKIVEKLLRDKNPINSIEEMLNIPYFIYSEEQKILFLKKVLLICDIYGQHLNSLRIYLEDKLNKKKF